MEDAPTVLKIPKSECPDIWIRLFTTHMAKIMGKHRRPSDSSCAKFVRTLPCRIIVGNAVRRSSVRTSMGENPSWSGSKGYSWRYTQMILKWLERNRIWLLCGRNDENVGLDEPTSFLDHVYFG